MRLTAVRGVALVAVCALSACHNQSAVKEGEPPSAPPLLPVTIEKSLPVVAIAPAFVNVAKEMDVDFTFFNDQVIDRYFLPEVMGGGAAWFDYDLDGWLDLYLVNGDSLADPNPEHTPHVNRLYRGDGGAFYDVATEAGVLRGGGFGQGVCVGDFDADGFPDLYIANYGSNRLFRNNGDGTFVDATEQAGVGDPLWGSSCVWADLDGDGLLDLYVTNYLHATLANIQVCQYDGKPGYCGPGAHDAAQDRAYLNLGDGTFAEAAERLGLNSPNGKGLAVAVVDFDGDTVPEIYVANDMAEDFLYRRTGGSEAGYQNIGSASGISVAGSGGLVASMGLSCADFDSDGLIDILVTNYYSHGNILFRNVGDLLFVDDSRRTRVAAASFQNLGFGTVPFDYDWDGHTDLFVANGHVLGPLHEPNEMHPQLLHNDGKGLFKDVSPLAGPYFDDRWLGRGAAGGDFDNDGAVDLVVTHLHRPVAVLKNQTKTPNHFIGFDLRTPTRVPPLGGRIVVTAGERRLTAPIVGGGSYLCCGDPRVVVGIGAWEDDVAVEIHWPSGHVSRYDRLEVDRYWRILEGKQPESGLHTALTGGIRRGP